MMSSCRCGKMIAVACVIALWCLPAIAIARDDPARKSANSPQKPGGPGAADESVKSIDDDYHRELVQLERKRLDRLARLAARQDPKDAAVTYELLFRLAISGDLFRDAEPAANAVISRGISSPIISGATLILSSQRV